MINDDRVAEATEENNLPSIKFHIVNIPRAEWMPPDETTDICFFCGGVFPVADTVACIEIYDGDLESRSGGVCCDSCVKHSDETLTEIFLKRANIMRMRAYVWHDVSEELRSWVNPDEDTTHPMNTSLTYLHMVGQELLFELGGLEMLSAFTEIIRTETPRSFPGIIYLLGSPEGYCKIGRTKHLTQRLLQLGLQLPFRVEILYSFKAKDCIAMERSLHRRFAHARQNGEWFLLSPKEIDSIRLFQDEID